MRFTARNGNFTRLPLLSTLWRSMRAHMILLTRALTSPVHTSCAHTPRTLLSRTRVHPNTVLATVALSAVVLVGCSSTESMLAESDVPAPEGLETVRSADIRRAKGTLSGGTFLLAGPVMDAGQLLDETTARYQSAGWQIVEREPGLDRAAATYAKDTRTTRLEILRRTVEPDMSSATIEVRDGAAAQPRGDK